MSDPVDQGRQIRFLGAQLVHDGFDLEADFSPENVMSGGSRSGDITVRGEGDSVRLPPRRAKSMGSRRPVETRARLYRISIAIGQCFRWLKLNVRTAPDDGSMQRPQLHRRCANADGSTRFSASADGCGRNLAFSCGREGLVLLRQTCPWVQFLQPNRTHRKVKTLDPRTNPTHCPNELHTTNNKPSRTKKTT